MPGRGVLLEVGDFRSQVLTAPISLEQRPQVQVVTPEMDVQGVQVLSAGLPLAGLTPLSMLATLPECSCLSSGTDRFPGTHFPGERPDSADVSNVVSLPRVSSRPAWTT